MSAEQVNEVVVEAQKAKPGFFGRILGRLRNYFFTGLLVAAPPALTIYLAVVFINFIDGLIPADKLADKYKFITVPGVGFVIIIAFLILLGCFTTGYIGKVLVRLWNKIWEKIPFINGIYSTFRQLFETIFSKKTNAFRQVVMVRFPRDDVWTMAFVTGDVPQVVTEALPKQDYVSVYVPTTPNPTGGYWGIYRKEDVIPLNIPVEEGLKMIISLGIVQNKKGPLD
ncbi:MAG: DUF502 domain-containing protein [Alphaproteobacteria bacterium]|nr:DUF502 domain-containing protein [Alphaproteobacteria bacterium]